VPISIELRTVLFRFGQVKERAAMKPDLMVPAAREAAAGTSATSLNVAA
jgi:hypothetical protein